jgi:HNH endonuclease
LSLRVCIYCDRQKPEDEFSLEHIFPDRLGGTLCSDLFKTRNVCERCNSLMGLFVDGHFIKNWFRNNHDASAAREYIDLKSPQSIEPLTYMGRLNSIATAAGEVWELWLGPCGALYYHSHQADDDRFNTYAGGDPIRRKSDPGRVYLFLTSENLDWNQLAIRSLIAAFLRAERFAGNFGITNDAPGVLSPSDDLAKSHLAMLGTFPN